MTSQVPTCPLCAAAHARVETSLDVAQVVGMWRRHYDLDVGSHFSADSLRLIACRRCGLRFFDPPVAGDGAFYERLQSVPMYYMRRKWEHIKALEALKGGDTVLEVGCGAGAFLEDLSKAGIAAHGVELNEKAAAMARELGLSVSVESVEAHASRHPAHYDAVCAFQVLEHIPQPRPFLDAACTALKPGGRLILGVPNRRSFLRLSMNLLDMPPHHVTRWDRHVMRACQRIFPLKLDRCLVEPLGDHQRDAWLKAHLDAVIARMALPERCRPFLWKWAERILRRLHLQSFLAGETLYVCFRKTVLTHAV